MGGAVFHAVMVEVGSLISVTADSVVVVTFAVVVE